MNALERIAYLAATDPDFRRLLAADPTAAIGGESLSPEEQEIILNLHHLLGRSPEALTSVVSSVAVAGWLLTPAVA